LRNLAHPVAEVEENALVAGGDTKHARLRVERPQLLQAKDAVHPLEGLAMESEITLRHPRSAIYLRIPVISDSRSG
jgi:hypothetical protein